MKLEELAGALTELKEQLFISIKEESAEEANDMLLAELRKRIMAGQREPIKSAAISKSTNKKLNTQQSKFLKQVPAVEKPQGITEDAIQLQNAGNRYTIGIDSKLPPHIKECAKVTEADIQQYINTITENVKKQLDQLL